MPGTLLEPNLHHIWLAKQSTLGTPIATTAMTKKPKLVDGGLALETDSGSEPFSDGTQFGDQQTYVNSQTGAGAPAFMADPDILAYLLWLFHGVETVSIAGTNNVQTGTMTGTPTGGTVRLTYDGRRTATIAYNAAAAAVQTALEALPNIGTGGVVCGGGPWPGTPITVTFSGSFTQKRPHPTITLAAADNALTGGTTPTLSFAQTTPGVLATHTVTGTGTTGHWVTVCQTTGSATKQQHRFGDGRISALTFDAGRGQMVARVTAGMLFIQPALNYAVDPTPTLSPFQGLVYTEGFGGWTFGSTVFTGQTSFQLSLNLDLSFVFGDRSTPHAVQRGNAGLTITASTVFDEIMLAEWNRWVYGTATPGVGTAPTGNTPPVDSYSWNIAKKDSAANTIGSFVGSIPGIQWEIPPSAAPNLGSGSQEVTLTGRLSRLSGQEAYTMTVGNQSAAYTV